MMAKASPLLTSRLIIGVRPQLETEQALRESLQTNASAELNPCVFEVQVGRQLRYCCWAGGDLLPDPARDGEPWPQLTLAGQGAAEALASLPFLAKTKFIFQQLKVGKTPLQQKIVESFYMTSGSRAPICFVGDLAGELNGKMAPAFNFNGYVSLEECIQRAAGNFPL